MGCFGGSSDDAGEKQQQQQHASLGIAEPVHRKCRDVVFLIIFALFWVGMFVVCGIAVQEGDPDRLIYGMDSYGFLCGTVNKISGMEVDLRKQRKLYFLNPLELLDPKAYLYAKSVCVNTCPPPADRCNLASLPCDESNLYRCPYYLLAERGVYRTLNTNPAVSPFSTQYFGALPSSTIKNCTKALPAGANTKLSEGVDVNKLTCGQFFQLTSQYGKGPCYPVWVSTVDFLNRCYPDASLDDVLSALVKVGATTAAKVNNGKAFAHGLVTARKRTVQYIADLQRGYEVLLLAGVCGGLILTILWMVILRYFVGIMAWVTIIALNALLFAVTLFAYDKAGKLTQAGAVGAFLHGAMPDGLDPAKQYQDVWLVLAIVLTIIFVIMFLLTIVMIRRIKIAIATIKEASRSVAAIPMALVYPVLPFAFNVGLVLYWVSIFGLLYSAGDKVPHYRKSTKAAALSIANLYNVITDSEVKIPPAPPVPPPPPMTAEEKANRCPTDPNCYFTYEWNNKLLYAFLYHLWGLLWTHQFFMGATYITLGGAFGYYYWSGGSRSRMPASPLWRALRNTSSYHLGSAALGGAVVAVLQFVRLILQYTYNKLRQAGGQACCQWCCCCAQCCMLVVQKVVEFINKQAYVMVGVKGYSYCGGASAAVRLIISNATSLTAVNVLADIMILLGKLAVSAGCALLAFIICDQSRYSNRTKNPKTYVSTPLLVVLFSALIGYIIADVFLSVFEIAIEAIILCFCEDRAAHGGMPKYAPPTLMAAIDPNFRKGQPAPDSGYWRGATPPEYKQRVQQMQHAEPQEEYLGAGGYDNDAYGAYDAEGYDMPPPPQRGNQYYRPQQTQQQDMRQQEMWQQQAYNEQQRRQMALQGRPQGYRDRDYVVQSTPLGGDDLPGPPYPGGMISQEASYNQPPVSNGGFAFEFNARPPTGGPMRPPPRRNR